MTSDVGDFSAKIRELYALTADLEKLAEEKGYPSRHFTPDGHMVGSIGEVVAAEEYELQLLEASHPVHDAVDVRGRLVQIKATQGDRISISDCPDYLIVLKITQDGRFVEIYNGPGRLAWELAGKKQKTGQRPIALSKLRKVAAVVNRGDRIPSKVDRAMSRFCEERQQEFADASCVGNLLQASYEACLVVADYAERAAGLDKEDLLEASSRFLERLSDWQLLGVFSWHVRRDYWVEDSLAESVSSGAMVRIAVEWLRRDSYM